MNRAQIIQRLRQPKIYIPLALASIGAVGALIAFAVFYSGYFVGRYELGPFETAQRGEYRIFGVHFERAAQDSDKAEWGTRTGQLSSIFFNLDTDITRLDVSRPGRGGGLTSLGEDVLLITHTGQIFAGAGTGDMAETALAAPDNDYRGYAAAARTTFKDLNHNLSYFRYNDILHYRSDAMRGLAVSYTEWDRENDCFRNTVSVLPIDRDVERIEEITAAAEDWRVVFRSTPCLVPKETYRAVEGHAAGGRIAFKAPGLLYLSSGDFGFDGVYAREAIAQDPDNNYGKVIEIDIAAGEGRNYSTGHRNGQGIVFDPDGNLWVAEHGARGGDELNLVREGKNYGWPVETFGTQYSGLPIPNTLSYGHHDVHTPPVYSWLPSIATSSLTVIDGFHDIWNGDLLLASLQSANLYRIRLVDRHVQFTEVIEVGQRIRYAHQHNDGRIVLWTDDHYLVFLSPSKTDATVAFIDDYIAGLDLDDRTREKLRASVGECMVCHSFRPDMAQSGPALGAVAGARKGAGRYNNYSSALRNAGGRWDREALIAYIDNPSAVAPGTTMPDPGIGDPQIQAALADLLFALRENNE